MKHADDESEQPARLEIESYRELIAYVGDQDPTARRLLEYIRDIEERRAESAIFTKREKSC